MPKGYRKTADWDGFAMAVADAQYAEQLAAVKRDDPRIPVPQDAVWAEVKRERDQLRARLVELTNEGWYSQVQRLEAEVARLRHVEQVHHTYDGLKSGAVCPLCGVVT